MTGHDLDLDAVKQRRERVERWRIPQLGMPNPNRDTEMRDDLAYSAADVPALVSEVERLRAEWDRALDRLADAEVKMMEERRTSEHWLAEVERLRAELADHHCDCLAGKIAEFRADRDRLAARLQAVSMIHAWTNEDGKRFLFADDVLAVLAVPAATEETAHVSE